MIKAWRRADGEYELIVGTLSGWLEGRERMRRAGIDPDWQRRWVSPEVDLERHGAEKVYGVVAGPSSCGCEPAGFRWVTASEVEAGETTMKPCHDCAMRRFHPPSGPFAYVRHQCDIIDVCGEADEAEAIYASEFANKLGAIT